MVRKKTWLFSVLVGILSFVLVRILQQRKAPVLQQLPHMEPQEIVLIEASGKEAQKEVPEKDPKPRSSDLKKPDDLKKIEGIGPKISGVLIDAGISTFEKLSKIDLQALEQILKDANLRLAKPATWPEQAALAAKNDWDGLKIFQQDLKGGVRK